MSASPRPALSAIAFRLAGALQAYECEIDQALSGSPSLERCADAGRRLDEVVLLKGALPQLSVQMVELLVCHADLMHLLWGAVTLKAPRRAELLARHRQAIRAMHDKCVRLFCLDGPTG